MYTQILNKFQGLIKSHGNCEVINYAIYKNIFNTIIILNNSRDLKKKRVLGNKTSHTIIYFRTCFFIFFHFFS